MQIWGVQVDEASLRSCVGPAARQRRMDWRVRVACSQRPAVVIVSSPIGDRVWIGYDCRGDSKRIRGILLAQGLPARAVAVFGR